jgi:uncharacterized repeat protein (TIGR01451 family)
MHMKIQIYSMRRFGAFPISLRTHLLAAAAIGCVSFASTANAAPTLAGTDIENIATASYDTPSGPVTIDSNKVVIKVDELLDVTVTSSDPGDVTTAPGQVGNVLKFLVTNTGNGNEAFALTADAAKSGDDFDPTLQQIVLDTNNNGVYDAGVDTVYVAGTNDPSIAPETSITVFILTTTPANAANGNRAEVGLTAAAKTGIGAPGTTFAGAGEGGGDAVVGTTGADATDSGFLAVQAATLALVKSAVVTDPFGGDRSVPGSTITYKLVATVTGSGSLANVVITDPIPASTTYTASSITLETAAQTDAADVDAGSYNGTQIRVSVGNVPAGQTRTVTFKVLIQ